MKKRPVGLCSTSTYGINCLKDGSHSASQRSLDIRLSKIIRPSTVSPFSSCLTSSRCVKPSSYKPSMAFFGTPMILSSPYFSLYCSGVIFPPTFYEIVMFHRSAAHDRYGKTVDWS